MQRVQQQNKQNIIGAEELRRDYLDDRSICLVQSKIEAT